jgi:hypothetical protein
MGQFLHIGLVHQLAVDKKELQKNELSLKKVDENIHQNFFLDTSLYDLVETKDDYIWTLQKIVLEQHLYSFLRGFYPQYYGDSETSYQPILEELEGKTAEECIKKAMRKSTEVFQMDNYFDTSRLYFEDKNIKIYFKAIIIALEGKIMMECYHHVLKFFSESLRMRFQESILAKTLKVYIS